MYSEGFHQEKYKSIKNLLGFYFGSLKDPNNYRGQRKALIIKHRYNNLCNKFKKTSLTMLHKAYICHSLTKVLNLS